MQLTGPTFLFLFLPLSLLLVLLLPKAHRRIALSLLSMLWYILAGRDNPMGLAHIALLVFFSVIMAYLPTPHGIMRAKLRVGVWVAVPLISFLAARLALEYGPDTYTYPTGLLFVTLAAVSFAIDTARGDAIRPRNPLELMGYLLFFPTVTMGPILRSKQYFDLTENIGFDPEFFCFGVRKYMLGYIKRLAVAAVVLRAFSEMMVYTETAMHPISFVAVLILSFVGFYFAVTGTVDMARGVCAMYGIPLPRDRARLVMGTSPDLAFYGVLLSLRKFLADYLLTPLRRQFGGKGGRVLATLLLFVCTVLLWRTRPEMLLLALPILLFAFLGFSRRVRKVMTKNTALRILFCVVSCFLCAPLTLALALDEPLQIFSLATSALRAEGSYPFYDVFSVIRDAGYLLLLILALLLLLPYGYVCKWLRRRVRGRTRTVILVTETVLLFVGFVATLIYLTPQFPSYATHGIYHM